MKEFKSLLCVVCVLACVCVIEIAWDTFLHTGEGLCAVMCVIGVFGIVGAVCAMVEGTKFGEAISEMWANSEGSESRKEGEL